MTLPTVRCVTLSLHWIPAGLCGPPRYIEDSHAVLFVSQGHQVVTYTCNRGHRFDDGTTQKTIHCQEGGVWPGISDCHSKRRYEQYKVESVTCC